MLAATFGVNILPPNVLAAQRTNHVATAVRRVFHLAYNPASDGRDALDAVPIVIA